MKKTIVFLVLFVLLGIIALTGVSTKHSLSPVSTNAQQSQTDVFETINQKAKQNKINPSFNDSKDIADLLSDNLLVLEIPAPSLNATAEQVAAAHLNGSSAIDENNIVAALNYLAAQSSAPAYAYTNVEQVRVVRSILNRVIPDLVSPTGTMTDLEAYAVFEATLSQKLSNGAFMVTPAEFSANLTNPVNQPLPGSLQAAVGQVELTPESAKAIEMSNVVDNYANSNNRASSADIVSLIGIN